MLNQAVDQKGRYMPVDHVPLSVGDIVLIKEENTKISNYPLGVIKEIFLNDLGEVTHALVLKGRARQVSLLHSTMLIPYMKVNTPDVTPDSSPDSCNNNLSTDTRNSPSVRSKRTAAIKSRERTQRILNE